jgi:hypothetical protein
MFNLMYVLGYSMQNNLNSFRRKIKIKKTQNGKNQESPIHMCELWIYKE